MPKLIAAGATDVGRQREVNEDRFHFDAARGVFIVVDGVGGQAAGGKAADTAIATLRQRLEQPTGSAADRIREAIAAANNEIHRQAATRPEWEGMACVLTVAVVEGDRGVIGHVGDTRLYKLRGSHIEKVTPDHSPVGEREDANEISELEAMRHPRRNEVYRDVGSDAHEPGDPDFISITEIDVFADMALLLCSDGLTDLVPSESIRQTVAAHAGRPDDVVRALIDAANAAGGKDNVTVVYAEGSAFATSVDGATRPIRTGATTSSRAAFVRGVITALLAVLVALAVWQIGWPARGPLARVVGAAPVDVIVVGATDSIMAAIDRAPAGYTVVVEPGEYRERLVLKNDVRVMSRVPRGATLRLPSSAAESDPAVVATDITGAELIGFRIIGDAATPLGIGVITRNAGIRLLDIEITGAAIAAVDLGPGDGAELVGSEIHGNGGAALIVRSGAVTRIAHNVFAKNGTSERARGAFVVETAAQPRWQRNVFQGIEPPAFVGMDEAHRALLSGDNWFVNPQTGATTAPSPSQTPQAARAAKDKRGK